MAADSRIATVLLRLCATALLTAAAACTGADPPAAGNGPLTTGAGTAEFVGTDACAGCHAAEAELWSGSHHDLAMQAATPETVLGDFDDASFTAHGVTSRFFIRDGQPFVRIDGPDGALHDYAVTHTFGADPLQQYLVEMPDGRRQALGIAWDSRPADAGGQRWFHLYEALELDAADPLHWTASAHTWNTRCAACHSTGLEKSYLPDEDRFATTWAGIDVGCEACHGPGSLHASAPSDFTLALSARDRAWVFEDSTSTAQRVELEAAGEHVEIEVCAQCHSRRAQLADALAPGDPLLDRFIPALLEDGLYHPDGQILDEVFVYGSFVQSAMHRAGVTCSDCHEPHGARLVADGNGLCTRCHASEVFDTPRHHHHSAGEPGGLCVDCHMPAQTYMVVDPRRDHSLRVPRPDLTVSIGTPNACGGCHASESAEWAAARVREWFPEGRSGTFHYGEALAAARDFSAARAPLLARVIEDRTLPGIARASAVRRLADQVDAGVIELVAAALEDDDSLVQLAALEVLEALPGERRVALGQRFLTHPLRALRITAARTLAPVRAGLSERRRADLDAALNEYFAVQLYNTDSAEGWFNRASLDLALGRTSDAEAGYRRALEQEPAFAPGYANLADLYRNQGRETDAEAVLREGLAASPQDAGLNYALGLSLVRSGRLEVALPALERAAELAPDEPLYLYAVGLALVSAGETDRAKQALAAAHDRFPGHPPILLALATLHRDDGDLEQALGYARRLVALSPSDASAHRLVAELETRTSAP